MGPGVAYSLECIEEEHFPKSGDGALPSQGRRDDDLSRAPRVEQLDSDKGERRGRDRQSRSACRVNVGRYRLEKARPEQSCLDLASLGTIRAGLQRHMKDLSVSTNVLQSTHFWLILERRIVARRWWTHS